MGKLFWPSCLKNQGQEDTSIDAKGRSIFPGLIKYWFRSRPRALFPDHRTSE